jgi:hypothetical protein
LKFCGHQSLEELRERSEWVRWRATLPYLVSANMSEKGLKELFKSISAPFYWEKESKPKRTKEEREEYLKHFKALFDGSKT